MRFRSFRSVLDECLDAIRQGETVETCLARYPRHASRLKPLLTLAEKVRRTPSVPPRPWAQATAWSAVRQRAADLRAGKRRAASIQVSFGWLKPMAVAFALLLAIGATSGATAFASQDALPNETLYPVKLFTEDVHVWLTFDETTKADVLLDQSDERMHEIAALVSHSEDIPENVLSALQDRNERAIDILDDRPQETVLWDRARKQAESQERILIALWDQVEDDARTEYTQVVADIHNTRSGGAGAAVALIQPEDLAGGIRTISGAVEEIEPGFWAVGGVRIRVDGRTIGAVGVAPGSTASFTVGRSTNGRLYALSTNLIKTDAPPTQAVVYGEVEEITDDQVRIGGQWIPLTADTLRKLQIRKGQSVQVTVNKTDTGIVASQVSAFDASVASSRNLTLIYEGNIQGGVAGTSEDWTIGGLTFADTANTRLDLTGGAAVDGARALVEATWTGDQLLAQSITVINSSAPGGQVYLAGIFEFSRSGLWRVSGLELEPRNNMQEPEAGSLVAIDATEADGVLTVKDFYVIQGPADSGLSRFIGTAISIENTTWNMEIGKVRVASGATEVSGRQVVGGRAIVWFRPGDGVSQAVYVHILDQNPVVQAPEPTPTAEENQ